eukprot:m.76188 g.76188  ORF g.76188 m.76188 type:complete len:1183 (+) comp14505_c0_seq1:207-3755(+)
MPGDRQRVIVCAVCWHASNHRASPQLTAGPPDDGGRCPKCKLAWKPVNLVYIARTKKWAEIRPRPSGVTSAFKVCEYAPRREGGRASGSANPAVSCPNRMKCTFAHSQAELEEWQRERDVAGSSRIRKPDTERSKLCVHFVKGRCTKEDCTVPHQFARCDQRFNGVGFCTRDAQCPFAHSAKELQAWNNWLVRTPMAGTKEGVAADELAADKTFYCEHCQVSCSSGRQLQEHFQSEQHLATMRGAKAKKQAFREAPRNVFGEYRMCRFVASGRHCDFGAAACTFAHSEGELAAWRAFRAQQVQQQAGRVDAGPGATASGPGAGAAPAITHPGPNPGTTKKRQLSATFPEVCLGLLSNVAKGAVDVQNMIAADAEGGWAHHSVQIEEQTGQNLVCRLSTPHPVTWVFRIKCTEPQKLHVMLLDVTHPQFRITRVESGPESRILGDTPVLDAVVRRTCFQDGFVDVHVVLKPSGFGAYSQLLVFKFASGYVARQLRVDAIPESNMAQLGTLYRGLHQSRAAPVEDSPAGAQTVVPFGPLQASNPTAEDLVQFADLQPPAVPTEATEYDQKPVMYRTVMHGVVESERVERTLQLSRLRLTDVSLVPVHGAPRGEAWFGVSSYVAAIESCLHLAPGDLAIIKPRATSRVLSALQGTTSPTVVQGMVAESTFRSLVLRVGADAAPYISSVSVDVRLLPNNKRFRRQHAAFDAVRDTLIFPKPHGPHSRNMFALFDEQLNPEQVQAVHLAVGDHAAPGMYLVQGPAATGKTRTILEVVKQTISQPGRRVLMCCASDDDADALAKLLMLDKRTAHHVLRLYDTDSYRVCQVPSNVAANVDATRQSFVVPTAEQVSGCRVIVTTVADAGLLSSCAVGPDHFSLVIVDDCGHCTEAEVIVPLSLAGDTTKCLLFGDTRQAPFVHCGKNWRRYARRSLLARLSARPGWGNADAYNCVVLSRNYSANAPLLHVASGSLFSCSCIASYASDQQIKSVNTGSSGVQGPTKTEQRRNQGLVACPSTYTRIAFSWFMQTVQVAIGSTRTFVTQRATCAGRIDAFVFRFVLQGQALVLGTDGHSWTRRQSVSGLAVPTGICRCARRLRRGCPWTRCQQGRGVRSRPSSATVGFQLALVLAATQAEPRGCVHHAPGAGRQHPCVIRCGVTHKSQGGARCFSHPALLSSLVFVYCCRHRV